MEIGGFFPYSPLREEHNNYAERLCPEGAPSISVFRTVC